MNTTIYLPWGTSISTDLHAQSRRGYNDKAMNTNDLIWNAQISHGFLKDKALTVMLQFYDILKQQNTFKRTFNAMMRTDTQYNNINSYAMLHVTYRLNLFGGQGNAGKPPHDGFHNSPERHGGGHGFGGNNGGFGKPRRFGGD